MPLYFDTMFLTVPNYSIYAVYKTMRGKYPLAPAQKVLKLIKEVINKAQNKPKNRSKPKGGNKP